MGCLRRLLSKVISLLSPERPIRTIQAIPAKVEGFMIFPERVVANEKVEARRGWRSLHNSFCLGLFGHLRKLFKLPESKSLHL